jgi:AcrR family transcriptional regulator
MSSHHTTAIGQRGQSVTSTEVSLLTLPPPAAVSTPSEQLQVIAQRITDATETAGASPAQARIAAATAVAAILDEFGGERIHLPSRRWFFFALLRPVLPTLARHMRGNLRCAEIAARLGVSRRTVERALRGLSDSHPLPQARADDAGSRG